MKNIIHLLIVAIACMPGAVLAAERSAEVELAVDSSIPRLDLDPVNAFTGEQSTGHVPHALFRLQYMEEGLIPGASAVEIDFNTDSLQLSWLWPELFGERTYSRLYGRGQALYGNMLADHAINGKQVSERGFGAGYLLAGGFFRFTPLQESSLQVSFDGLFEARQWFHYRLPVTHPDLILPANHPSFESTVSLDVIYGEYRTRFNRLHGVKLKSDGLFLIRPGIQDWGSINNEDNGRNANLGLLATRLKLTGEGSAIGPLMGGIKPVIHSKFQAGYGAGLDDRHRFMIGGVSPFVVRLAGAGWAEFLSDRFVSGHLNVGMIAFDYLLLEAGVDLVLLNDPMREGEMNHFNLFRGYFAQSELALADRFSLLTVLSFASGSHRKEDALHPAVWSAIKWRL